MSKISRRASLKVILASAAAIVATPFVFGTGVAFAADKQINIGWQKGVTLAVAKARGDFEKAVNAAGIQIRWVEFPAGPQMLEALNVGSIDFGQVGEAPPVFAQAASANLLYVGNQPPAPKAEKLLVQKDSPIKSVAELKGKRIVLNKGSNVHFLLVKLLEKAGLKYSDVQVSFLPPADARAAFESKAVDAWVIWDPYGASAEIEVGARILADAEGVAKNYQFFIAGREYTEKNPDSIRQILDHLDKSDRWIEQNIDQAAGILSPQIGVSQEVAVLNLKRYSYGITQLTDEVVRNQQDIADVFYDLKLIPKKLDINSVVWRPTQRGDKS